MPAVYVMIKPVSGLCNMRCSYCFYTDEMEKREQGSYGKMSLATLENVIHETLAYAEGECTFAYQGGEPTLAGLDFFHKSMELQKRYNKKKIKIHNALQTNGYKLNEEWCRFFRENDFLIGLSLDGIKAAHDSFRKSKDGQDTYLRVLKGAELLEKNKVEFNILTVVNAKTAPKIRRIYEQYRKLSFRYQQYIACLEPIGEKPGAQKYSLTPSAYGQFLCDLFELWELDLKKGRQPYIRQFENWVEILMGYQPEACEQRGVCTVQNIVEADGSVYPCDFYALDGYCIGNLNKDDFETINQKRQELGFMESSRNHSQECLACRYFMLCRGGCRRHREGMETPGGGNSNYFCEGYRMFFDRYFDRLCQIAAQSTFTSAFTKENKF